MSRDFDLVVFGATGFTGKLVADYLAKQSARETVAPRWAIAGRTQAKLEALGLNVPILVVDTLDRAQVDAVVKRTKAVCTTVGPYAKYGSELVAACADAGTHYCDLTGEPQWMRRMIDLHHERAKQTGARIVHTCGFDSIPSDLGAFAAQQAFKAKFGRYASKVTALFGEMSGGVSGGTIASAMETAREAGKDIAVRKNLGNPYGLDPDPEASKAVRPRVRDEASIGWEPHLKMFTVPFVMAQINTRVVRRAQALAGSPWGEDFVYREVMSAPGKPAGLARAIGTLGFLGGVAFAMKRPRLRALIAKRVPQPGDGPSQHARDHGHWKVRFVAEHGQDVLIYTAADRADPGYGSTAKMLGESALCLALDPLGPPGISTPSVAMGQRLLDRLRRTGLTFEAAG